MKKVILTGASGFIGQNAIPFLLERNFEVHCLYNSSKPHNTILYEQSVIWHQCDLLEREHVKKILNLIRPKYLLHFAWDVTPNSYLESINNFDWLVSSLDLLYQFKKVGGTKAVFAGTCYEYDLRFGYCRENLTPLKPSSYYGNCKNNLNSICENFSDQTGIDFAWGRIFHPFGPLEYSNRLVPSVIISLLNNETAKCTHGNQIRDFLYVRDVAAAFVAILVSDIKGEINIGSGKPMSINDFVRLIAKILGKENDVKFGAIPARQDDPPIIIADVNRLKNEIGWSQKYSLEEGIAETINWWKNKIIPTNKKIE